MPQLSPSIIRTIVPLLVQVIVAQSAKIGLDLGPYEDLLSQLIGAGVSAAYYAFVRWLETRGSDRWGWLLGLPSAPTYGAPAAPSQESPTGYEATEAAPIPEGEPVTVEPAGELTLTESEQEYRGRHRPAAAAFGSLPAHPVKRDRSSVFWLLVVPIAVAYELIMIGLGKTSGTLSGVSWSFLPPYSTAWWFVGMPFLALCLWLGPHVLFRWDGWVLAAMVATAVVVAAVGSSTT